MYKAKSRLERTYFETKDKRNYIVWHVRRFDRGRCLYKD